MVPERINLGSGDAPLPGFLNVDALPDAPGVDLVADISKRLPIEDGVAEVVYASHVLEHFPHAQTLDRLRDWRRVLREGGQLFVAVPDLDVIARMLTDRRGWFTPPNNPWLGAIYGGQKDEYDFHKAGFTAPWLAYLMNEAGFGDVRRVSRFPVDRGDISHAPQPFGVNVSLNMIGTAGAEPLHEDLITSTRVERAFERADHLLEIGLDVSTRVRASIMDRRRQRLERRLDDTG